MLLKLIKLFLNQNSHFNDEELSEIDSKEQYDQLALTETLEALDKLKNEYDSSAESLNLRAGVTCALFMAALMQIGFNFGKPDLVYLESFRVALIEIRFFFILFTAYGCLLILRSLTSGVQLSPFSLTDLIEKEWRKPKHEFQLQQIANYEIAIRDAQDKLNIKSSKFNKGIIVAFIGLSLDVILTIVTYITFST